MGEKRNGREEKWGKSGREKEETKIFQSRVVNFKLLIPTIRWL